MQIMAPLLTLLLTIVLDLNEFLVDFHGRKMPQAFDLLIILDFWICLDCMLAERAGFEPAVGY